MTAKNWTDLAGFRPDLAAEPKLVGTTLDKATSKEHSRILAKGLQTLVERHGLRLPIVAYKPIHPSLGYLEATTAHAGKAKLIETGKEVRKRGLDGYVAGLPFPQPKNGLEAAWNYQYCYIGDDGDSYYAVKWVSAARGVEHTEEWRWAFICRTVNRTDLPPKPAIEAFLKENIQYTSLTYALSPYDKKGFGALYSRSVDPLDQQGHIYVPAMRRVLRNTFGTRGDTWNSTDMLYEDVRGFMGYPEWMNWKLLGKETRLAPMHAGIGLGKEHAEQTFDFRTKPYWNLTCNWELRPTYLLEVTPKLADYPYSRQLIYVDAETFLIAYKETYDKKGELWKVLINGFNQSPDEDTHPPVYCASLVVDLQSEHATAFPVYVSKSNLGLEPGEFTLATLRKRGR